MSGRNGRRAKSPAFQAYPADFLSDPKTAAMSAEEIGCYWLLLCYAWLDGAIPNDEEFLSRLTRLTPARFRHAWKLVGQCFVEREDGRLVNPRQERERAFQYENRERLKERAGKANSARWDPTRIQDGGSKDPSVSLPNPESRIPTPDVVIPPGKPVGSRSKATGQHAECVQHWEAEWGRTRLGTKCVIQPKDGVAVAWMLQHADPLEVRRRMSAMLEDADPWMASNAALPLLHSKWDRYATAGPVRPGAPASKPAAQRKADEARQADERAVERAWNAKHATILELDGPGGTKIRAPGLDAKYPGYELAKAELERKAAS